ncbi:MAG: ABC transporter permease [Candidatus Kerfeldbacteria bacterium]|nr:ABC transporter permease [Candidatus Kerfeldbacteria bacterium]
MIGQAFTTALRSIWSKKARSFLTMLGVIIGVAQIIALIGLGQGVKQSVAEEVTQLGSNVLFVLPGKLQNSQGGFNPAASVGASTLTESDLELLKSKPEITTISSVSLLAGTPTTPEKAALGTLTVAVDPGYFEIVTTMKLVAGRKFTDEDNQAQKRVMLLGRTPRQTLFPSVPADQVIGRTVSVGKESFEVIGLLETEQSTSLFGGQSFDNMVFLPYLTGKATNENVQIFRIVMKIDPTLDVKAYAQQIGELLKDEHSADDITVFTQDDLLNVINDILGLITKAIVGLASISLIVGGIGIKNIMLVAVSERTKEIGLRKALGATRGNIMVQFLTESAVISLIGGAIGVGIATTVGIVTEAKANLPIVVNLNSIVIAVSFSLGVGVLFGLLPAIRAARRDPIEALRYE